MGLDMSTTTYDNPNICNWQLLCLEHHVASYLIFFLFLMDDVTLNFSTDDIIIEFKELEVSRTFQIIFCEI